MKPGAGLRGRWGPLANRDTVRFYSSRRVVAPSFGLIGGNFWHPPRDSPQFLPCGVEERSGKSVRLYTLTSGEKRLHLCP